jgi:hypothetical protein
MAVFDQPKRGDYPKKWNEMSLEFKLMFVYHGCMMVLFMTGGAFSIRQEIAFTIVLASLLTAISIRHRRSANWRWPGAKPKNVAAAIGGVILMGVFLYAATPLFPPSNPRSLPWYLAGLGIGIFNVLHALRLVQTSEAAFLAECHEPGNQTEPATPAEPTDRQWHRITRAAYGAAFFAVWLGFLAFFYYSGVAFRDGSPAPTPTKTEPMTQHGKTVYITPAQKGLCNRLELFAMFGIPSVIVAGPFLHFIVGVKLYPNTPTLREYLANKSGRGNQGSGRS